MPERPLHADAHPPRAHTLPSALETFDDVVLRLAGRRPALFLDFDGTLARIVPHPSQARLEPGLRSVLRRLTRDIPVGIISGRSVQDVKNRLHLGPVQIAGDHGLVFLEGDGERLAPPVRDEHLQALEAVARSIQARLTPVHGAWVERKRCTFAVHTRQVETHEKPAVQGIVDAALVGQRLLQAQQGKEVIDVRPRVEWDKGAAVHEMLRRLDLPGRNIAPIVIGDDVTDEPAFQAVREDGIGVIVGNLPRTTAARFVLADPGEVRRFLGLLHERLGLRGAPGPRRTIRGGPDL